MAQVIVRNIEAEVEAALKARAAQHGWSIEEEVRQILRRAVTEDAPAQLGLGSQIAARFAGEGLAEPLPQINVNAATPNGPGSACDANMTWDSFFLGNRSVVTPDFLEERASQDQPERESL